MLCVADVMCSRCYVQEVQVLCSGDRLSYKKWTFYLGFLFIQYISENGWAPTNIVIVIHPEEYRCVEEEGVFELSSVLKPPLLSWLK